MEINKKETVVGLGTERLTVNLEDAARVLGVSRAHIYAAANRGELPGAFRVGRRWLVSRRALEQLIGTAFNGSGHAQ